MNSINIQYHKTKIGELILGSFDDRLCLLDFRYRKMRTTVDNRIKMGLKADFSEHSHRTTRTKNCVSRSSFLGLGFKMLQQAEKRWIGIYAPEKVLQLFAGVKFIDGLPANLTLPDDQQTAA